VTWCRDTTRDAAVRAAEDGRTVPLPTLAEAIARPFADAAERSVTLSKTGEGQSGMRTERVVLEITGAPGWRVNVTGNDVESVRVVKDGLERIKKQELIRQRDAAIRERDKLRGEITSVLDRAEQARSERDNLQARVAELEAASGGGEGDAVAWGVTFSTNQLCFNVYSEKFEAEAVCERINTGQTDYESCTVVPLYAARSQPRGWLTEEERKHIFLLAAEYETQAKHLEKPGTWGSGLPTPSKLRADAAMLRNLFARSTPPEVVLESWREAAGEVVSLDDVRAALDAIGVAVKLPPGPEGEA